MKKLYLVIGIVAILAIVCSPALAINKADLMASYPVPGPKIPESFSCCSDDTFGGMNYTSVFTDDGGSSPEPGPTWGPTWDTPPHAPGSPPPGSPPTPIPSLEELIASYIVKPYSDPITCCDDCTPQQQWSKGTVTPTPTPTPVPHDSADDSDCDECREPGVYCGCDHGPSSGGVPVFITPLTPTVEGSMKLTERHTPQLPPYMPSWVTPLFF